MTHVHDDDLMLLAWGELEGPQAAIAEAHLTDCTACRDRLARLARSRAVLDWAATPRRRPLRWILAAGLAAAAVFAIVLVLPGRESAIESRWSPPDEWSATAGYIAGGATVVEIDARLTRLEQERYYEMPD
jgi:hypothetical protein